MARATGQRDGLQISVDMGSMRSQPFPAALESFPPCDCRAEERGVAEQLKTEIMPPCNNTVPATEKTWRIFYA